MSLPLDTRLEALSSAHALAQGRLGAQDVQAAAEVLERSAARRTLSSQHTVVGFFGATGSGKSTLFNAVAGVEVATASARRPTTSEPLAAIWGEDGSQALLDWLEVRERHVVSQDGHLILLDLPDIDSVSSQHRIIAERLAGMVDVLVWVMDPQKYADQIIHEHFVRPLAGHGAVTLAVLNQADRLRAQDLPQVLADLEKQLRADGLEGVSPLAVSALTGDGVDDLVEAIDEIVRSQEASGQRLAADVRRSAEAMREALGGDESTQVTGKQLDELASGLASAARAEQVADAAAASYRRRAHQRTGWPLVRWLSKRSIDPLARLGLVARDGSSNPDRRTSLPPADAGSVAQADAAVRHFADSVSEGGSESWRGVVRRAARSRREELPDALDQAVARTDLRAGKTSWWWQIANVMQWLALLLLVVGLGWLTLAALAVYFQIPLPPAPSVVGLGIPIPLPTMLVVLGIALGLLVALTTGAIAALAARRERTRVLRLLRAAVRDVGERYVADPVRSELQRADDLREVLELAAAP
ncbi:GTPase [Dermabacteraceae bacterium P13115]